MLDKFLILLMKMGRNIEKHPVEKNKAIMKTSPGERRRLGFEQTKVVSVALGFSLRRDET